MPQKRRAAGNLRGVFAQHCARDQHGDAALSCVQQKRRQGRGFVARPKNIRGADIA